MVFRRKTSGRSFGRASRPATGTTYRAAAATDARNSTGDAVAAPSFITTTAPA